MPKSSNPLNLAVSALLVMMAVPITIVGVVGLFTAGEIWWVFGLMAASGGMMAASAVQNVFKWKKAVAEEEATTRAMLEATQPPAIAPTVDDRPHLRPAVDDHPHPSIPGSIAAPAPAFVSAPAAEAGRLPGPVLAHWRYDPAEWSAYTEREAAYRTREAIWVGVGMAALGTVILGWSEGDWGMGFAVSASIAALVAALRWGMARSARASNLSVPGGEVIIAPNAILLNGRYEVLQDHNFRFGGVRYLETERPPILEFTVTWATRGGRTNEQYRVPVPAGREDEARALVDTFRGLHAGALAG
jgi:hypothetical protein